MNCSEKTITELWSKRKAVRGLTIKGFKYSEAGKGKSVPDQYAAILKRKIHDSVVSGMDADTEENLAKCISSAEGVSNVRTFLGSVKVPDIPATKKPKKKIAKIRNLHEFIFNEKGVHVRALATIGRGMTIPLEKIKLVPKFEYKEVKTQKGGVKRTFTDYNPTGPILAKVAKLDDSEAQGTNGPEPDQFTHTKEDLEMMERGLFPCPNPLCTLSYENYDMYKKHLSSLACVLPKTTETMKERVTKKYIGKYGISPHIQAADRREARKFVIHLQDLPEIPDGFLVAQEDLYEGHALQRQKKHVQHSPEQKKFMNDEFYNGLACNVKARADISAKKMHDKFPKELWLTEYQIKSYFSRLQAEANKRKKSSQEEPDQEPSQDEIEAAAMELDYIEECREKQNVMALLDNDSDTDSEDSESNHPIKVSLFLITTSESQITFPMTALTALTVLTALTALTSAFL